MTTTTTHVASGTARDVTDDWRSTMMDVANTDHAIPLAFECVYTIDVVADQMLTRAEDGHPSVEVARLMRVFQTEALRIKQLNLVLLSFLTGDEMTAGAAYRAVYGNAPTRGDE